MKSFMLSRIESVKIDYTVYAEDADQAVNMLKQHNWRDKDTNDIKCWLIDSLKGHEFVANNNSIFIESEEEGDD